MIQQQYSATILVVDDHPSNVELLIDLLFSGGYESTISASDGYKAIQKAQQFEPDLILLDLMMPGMSGYDVCKTLKSDPQTSDIPVLIISALDRVQDKVTAFAAGAVDYITKPFQRNEVLARVKTHLHLRHMQQQLEQQTAALKYANVRLRERNQELDAFARTVAHDLKGPLASLVGLADVVTIGSSRLDEARRNRLVGEIRTVSYKMSSIVDELLLLARLHKADVTLHPVDMKKVLQRVQTRLTHLIKRYDGTLEVPDSWPKALGYSPWIEEIWVNYVSNGLKYGGTSPRLTLGYTVENSGRVHFWVRDYGAGIAPEAQAQIFDEFVRLDELKVDGHGLGLSIVKRIANKLGGEVTLFSKVGHGATFGFTLMGAAE